MSDHYFIYLQSLLSPRTLFSLSFSFRSVIFSLIRCTPVFGLFSLKRFGSYVFETLTIFLFKC